MQQGFPLDHYLARWGRTLNHRRTANTRTGERTGTDLSGAYVLSECATGWGDDQEDLGRGFLPRGMRVKPSSDLGWLLLQLGTFHSCHLLDQVVLLTACSLVFEEQMSPSHAAQHVHSLLMRRLYRDCVRLFVTHRYPLQSLELAIAQELRIPFIYMDQHVRPMVVFPPMYDAVGDEDCVAKQLRYNPFTGEPEWSAPVAVSERAYRNSAFAVMALQLHAHATGDAKLFAALALTSLLHLNVAKALKSDVLHAQPQARVQAWNFMYEAGSPYSKCLALWTYARGAARRVRRRFALFQNVQGAGNFLLPHD